MKTLTPEAMAAIEAGEAIVTGAVEISPVERADTLVLAGAVDLSATENIWYLDTDLSDGVTLSGFDPSDVLTISAPPGRTYAAAYQPYEISDAWSVEFVVVKDGDTSDWTIYGGTPGATAEAARLAFENVEITGHSSYTFFIPDNFPSDNEGGVSLLVQRLIAGTGPADPIRLWGGHGPITFGGNTYQGVGSKGLAQQTSGAIGGVAQGLTIGLAGIDPVALELLNNEELKGADVALYRLIFASDGKTLLDAHVFDRGHVDTVSSDETIGGDAAINLAVESAARGLGRSGARQRSDSDQRLIDASDGYFKSTAFAGQKTLYWGGKKPAIGLHG